MEIKTNIHRRDAKSAERDGFSFAAERTAKEKLSLYGA